MEDKKVCIITGATSGIGKETAKAMAIKGYTLVLPVRNLVKGQSLVEELKNISRNDHISVMPCDLESLKSIREFVENFLNQYNRLDVLINNAGVWFKERELTTDGYEKNLAINHLAPFLLTNLLLDTLKKTGHARIVNVSSDAHKFSNMNFDDLMGERSYSSFKSYGQSKLANILFTRKLSKMLNTNEATVNCLHPGVVATNLFNKLGGFMKWGFGLFMISPEKGAETSVYLATSPEVLNTTGGYFKKKKAVQPRPYALNDESAEKLWNISMKLTGI